MPEIPRNPSLAAQKTPEGERYLKRIRAMTPYQRLLYWITERHKVHCLRFPGGYHMKDGTLGPRPVSHPKESEPPWTEDPILQTIFFCNPYRENDKVTAYLRDNFREEFKSKPEVFLGTILLRWFNYIPTMHTLIEHEIPQRLKPDKSSVKLLLKAYGILSAIRGAGGQLFGGAYIIKLWNGMGKLEAIMKVMEGLARNPDLYKQVCKTTMLDTHYLMRQHDGMGNFYCYQFIGDLAYTHVLAKAEDWKTWSFSGPGTSRSIHRLQGHDRRPGGGVWERRVAIPPNAEEYLNDVYRKVNADLPGINKHLPKNQKLTPIHMRDITGCLCEYDKYCRALNNERDLKRGYAGQ